MGKVQLAIELPDRLYALVKRRAATYECTVQEASVDLLASKLYGDEAEHDRIEQGLAPMDSYSDEQLLEATHGCLSREAGDRIAELNDRQQAEGLTIAERVEHASLLTRYDWHVLIRAKALALLKTLGHDIAPLLVVPTMARD